MSKMRLAFTALACSVLLAGSGHAAQIVLTPSAVIGTTGSYDSPPGQATGGFAAGNIFDQQTGPVSDSFATNYWINPDNGPANAYITVDLGSAQTLSSFDLFNTHNSQYGDRGTGNFTIIGGNTIVADGANGSELSGSTVTLVSGTLTAAPVSNPIAGQSFASQSSTAVRYLEFLPTSVASANNPCCGANVYGLNELRVFSAVPEPSSWALLLSGFGIIGWAMRGSRRQKTAAYLA